MSTITWLLAAVIILLMVVGGLGIAILLRLRDTREAADEAAKLAADILNRDPLGRIEEITNRLGLSTLEIAQKAGREGAQDAAFAVLEHMGYTPQQPALPAQATVYYDEVPDQSYHGVPHAGHSYGYDQPQGYPAQTEWQDARPTSGGRHSHADDQAPVQHGRSLMVTHPRGDVRQPGEPPVGYTRKIPPGATDAEQEGGYGPQLSWGERRPEPDTETIPRYTEDSYDRLLQQPGESDEDYRTRRDREQAAFEASLDRNLADVTGGYRRTPDGGLAPIHM